jgi:hypothetical protein
VLLPVLKEHLQLADHKGVEVPLVLKAFFPHRLGGRKDAQALFGYVESFLGSLDANAQKRFKSILAKPLVTLPRFGNSDPLEQSHGLL